MSSMSGYMIIRRSKSSRRWVSTIRIDLVTQNRTSSYRSRTAINTKNNTLTRSCRAMVTMLLTLFSALVIKCLTPRASIMVREDKKIAMLILISTRRSGIASINSLFTSKNHRHALQQNLHPIFVKLPPMLWLRFLNLWQPMKNRLQAITTMKNKCTHLNIKQMKKQNSKKLHMIVTTKIWSCQIFL